MPASAMGRMTAAPVLLACASVAAISGVLVAATPPLEESGLVFLPLVFGLVGVVASGHMLRRGLLAYVLALFMVGGWFFGFIVSYGLMPPGLTLAIGLTVVAAVYPFPPRDTRLILLASGLGGLLALCGGLLTYIGVVLRPVEAPLAQWGAIIANVIAVAIYATAAARAYRTPHTDPVHGNGRRRGRGRAQSTQTVERLRETSSPTS